MKTTETVKKVINILHEYDADEEVYKILEGIINEINNHEETFRDFRDVEIYLDNLREKYEKSNGDFNLYPSDKKGSCNRVCIGIASNPFDEKRYGLKTGFKGLMLNLCAYWFECLGVNKTTLIFTNDWHSRKFAEFYKEIIDKYISVHSKKVFIVEVDPAGFFLRYPF